ncbi:hypothetical protein K470DRAFT_212191 [Piedraia hortae CBS 480.64]|uniref:Uncharacterized protein n=1 Tax=Piedraia hortae CBS 480.64 TaxID=1314780 RepID=A0A6A7C6M4_9PEZI|nr:hypothetical protein K470DRAFT_212191 [Piedraia hortae CBS 480.64]
MVMASNGHFLGQMPQPMHRRSEMNAILDSGDTSMHSFPERTTGQAFLLNLVSMESIPKSQKADHSCRHFLGLHLSLFQRQLESLTISGRSIPELTIAMLADNFVSDYTNFQGPQYTPRQFIRHDGQSDRFARRVTLIFAFFASSQAKCGAVPHIGECSGGSATSATRRSCPAAGTSSHPTLIHSDHQQPTCNANTPDQP